MDNNGLMIIINGPDSSMPIEKGAFFSVRERGKFILDAIEEKKPSEEDPNELDITGMGFFEKEGSNKAFSFIITFYNPKTRHGYLEQE